MNENVRISINISLKFVPKGLINNIPALVKIMAWRRSGDKPLSEPMMVNLLTHICVTWPQWVNPWHVFIDLTYKMSATPPRGQWIKSQWESCWQCHTSTENIMHKICNTLLFVFECFWLLWSYITFVFADTMLIDTKYIYMRSSLRLINSLIPEDAAMYWNVIIGVNNDLHI